MSSKKLCVICGKEFVPLTHNAICCSPECSDERAYDLSRARYDSIKAQKAVNKKKKEDLIEIAKEARSHGMSYGKYVLSLQISKTQ